MADFYMSVTNVGNHYAADISNGGTSGTAGDKLELRMDQALTQREVLNGLARFKRWIMQGGLNGAGANLPPLRG